MDLDEENSTKETHTETNIRREGERGRKRETGKERQREGGRNGQGETKRVYI